MGKLVPNRLSICMSVFLSVPLKGVTKQLKVTIYGKSKSAKLINCLVNNSALKRLRTFT